MKTFFAYCDLLFFMENLFRENIKIIIEMLNNKICLMFLSDIFD